MPRLGEFISPLPPCGQDEKGLGLGWGWPLCGLHSLPFSPGQPVCSLLQLLPLLTPQSVWGRLLSPGPGQTPGRAARGSPGGVGTWEQHPAVSLVHSRRDRVLLSFRELWPTLGWVYLNGDSFSLSGVCVCKTIHLSALWSSSSQERALEPCGSWGPGVLTIPETLPKGDCSVGPPLSASLRGNQRCWSGQM